jgi:hypothetical protein
MKEHYMRVIQTMAMTYHAICQESRPWTALGNFLNEWWDYSKDSRSLLISDAIMLPATPTKEQVQWAAFCAATVEWLCQQDHVPCPVWVQRIEHRLSEPWFLAFHTDDPNVQKRLKEQTPEPFRQRNIYGGNRLFANKYAWAKEVAGVGGSWQAS